MPPPLPATQTRRHPRRGRHAGAGRLRQGGQALIEFAIIVLLMILLIAGGVELGTAALNSRVLRDAALDGAGQWAGAVSAFGRASGAGLAQERLLVAICPSASDVATAPSLAADQDPRCAALPPGAERRLVAASCGLGDHALDAFSMPACNDLDCNAPDDGLPWESADCTPDPGLPVAASDPIHAYRLLHDVYLFNPLPLDISDCVPPGESTPRGGCVNKLFAALPALNQSLRPAYQLRCMDAAQTRELACGSPAAVSWLLRLPGRYPALHPQALTPAVVHLGMLSSAERDPVSGNVASYGNEALDFPMRPTFQLECLPPNGAFPTPACDARDGGEGCACDARSAPAGVCWSLDTPSRPLACELRVGLRYRHPFYALTASVGGFFNPQPLSASAIALLDPGILDSAGRAVGGLGAEFTSQLDSGGALSSFRVPAKTFHGCASTRTVATTTALVAAPLACN